MKKERGGMPITGERVFEKVVQQASGNISGKTQVR
jgi:hypothetical protein